jgi:ABC-type sugar transport system ATPase subunit
MNRNLDIINSLRVKTSSLEAIAGSLSGGNQQKIILGKALLAEPKVILLDEPTRGIDTGAKQEIYGIIRQLAASGKAVLLVSSELPELMGLSDRILMLHEGEMAGVFSGNEVNQQRLLCAAMGQAQVELLET